MDRARLARLLFAGDDPTRAFSVRLWTGETLRPRRADPSVALVLSAPAAVELLLPPVSERRLAEAYISGLIDGEGDLIDLLEAFALWRGPRPDPRLLLPALRALVTRATLEAPSELAARFGGRKHSGARDRAAVRYHYDVSDEFYSLFLDERMIYSCAYFPRGDVSLEEAQRDKLELVCRKLGLQRGDRLLDVGCGWGGLLEHAARAHGARGLGVTLSQNQLDAARRRCAGLAEIRGADYRTLDGDRFDKIASIGMMEHVGRAHLDEYFGALFRLLRPGGLLLNHAIGDAQPQRLTVPFVSRAGGGFIQRYVFPDSDLIPLGTVLCAAEGAGFEVRDVESLREHYAQTLARWLRSLEQRFDEAVAVAGRERARLYRLYLAASSASFRVGSASIYQVLLAKRTGAGRAEGVPRSRRAWTEGEEQRSPGEVRVDAGQEQESAHGAS